MIRFGVHPRDVQLERYADHALAEARRRRVAQHLARCTRCRDTVLSFRRLARQAPMIGAPPLPAALRTRVLADRGRGERIILPMPSVAPRPAGRGMQIAAAACAAVLAALVWLGASVWHSAADGSPGAASRVAAGTLVPNPDSAGVNMGPSTMRYAMLAAVLWPSVAAAQAPAVSPPHAYPPVRTADATRLRPGRWQYDQRTGTDSVLYSPARRGTVVVETAAFEGQPAWRVVTSYQLNVRGHWTDTLYVRRDDLRPLARSAWTARAHLAQTFTADSIVENFRAPTAVNSPLRGQTFERRSAQALPDRRHGLLVADEASLRLLIPALPLTEDWRGSVALVGSPDVPTDGHPLVLDLAVRGEGRVRTPAGSFDCWKLIFEREGHPQVWWARKSDGLIVRTESGLGAGAVVETTLRASESSGRL